ncbi:uncharacterized protein [Amphiura filiformis]|uniref:uncharacterized protein n=1 Tax=Amphiura filiformis TaxID=82378 RepID=UPI003B2163F7
MSEFSLTKAVEEELLCHLCYDILKDPRDLECPHVFCLQCIKKLVVSTVTIECPECRHVTFVPTNGIDMLKPNLRMRNMIEKFSAHIKKTGSQDDLVMSRCLEHPDERLIFKCTHCDVLVCQYCIVQQHQRHEIQECSSNGVLNDVKYNMNKHQVDIQKLRAHLRYLTEKETSIARNVKSEELKLDQQVQMLTADLQSNARTLKAKMNVMKKQKLERLHEQRTVTKDRILKLEKMYASPNMPKVNPDEDEQNKLCDVLSKSCTLESLHTSQQHEEEKANIKFQSSNRCKVSASLFHIGQIVYKRKVTLTSEFGVGSFQKAQGIAVTKNGLLAVADSRANHVGVYRFEDSTYKRSFLLGASTSGDGKITRPLDVGVTADGKFLVIDSAMVKMYANDGRFERAFRTGLQDANAAEDCSAPQGITTTGFGGHDVIAVADLGRQVITLHKTSGTFLRMIKVDIDPRNRITTNGRQIYFTNYQEGKVCVLDFQSGEKIQQLAIPKVTAICLDERSGSLLLGRNDGTQGSGVIEQYCMTTGQFVTQLASGLYAALGMTLTDDDNLIVADMISVKVFSIKDL